MHSCFLRGTQHVAMGAEDAAIPPPAFGCSFVIGCLARVAALTSGLRVKNANCRVFCAITAQSMIEY
jgi:hypothetical protein